MYVVCTVALTPYVACSGVDSLVSAMRGGNTSLTRLKLSETGVTSTCARHVRNLMTQRAVDMALDAFRVGPCCCGCA